MPLFLRHTLLFIHIPKCGGDTVSHHLRNHGDPPFLFVDDGAVMVNGHSPQHMTWGEILQAGWSNPPAYRVATLVRHPVERVLSEYRYIHAFRPDLQSHAENPTRFLDAFLEDTQAARARFDNHNASIREFLGNHASTPDPCIDIYPTDAMDELIKSLGLPSVPITARRNVTCTAADEVSKSGFTQHHISRIVERYKEDILWFESRFPQATGSGAWSSILKNGLLSM